MKAMQIRITIPITRQMLNLQLKLLILIIYITMTDEGPISPEAIANSFLPFLKSKTRYGDITNDKTPRTKHITMLMLNL